MQRKFIFKILMYGVLYFQSFLTNALDICSISIQIIEENCISVSCEVNL